MVSLCRKGEGARVAEESRFLTFMGMRVHFSVSRPEGEPKSRMLLLCSPLITTFHWRKLLPELEQLGCLTVMVDLPGFGLSDCSAEIPQDPLTRANILWGILDDVDRSAQSPMSLWHLAGHGSTCATILHMAALCPDSTRSMIHISPLFRPSKADPAELARRYDGIVRSEARFRSFIEHYCGYPLDDYILDRMRRPLLRPGARESFARMLRRSMAPPEETPSFCPTLALWGGRDQWMDSAAQARVHRLLPEAESHILKSAGHFPMETHSRALRDYLRGWLKFND